MSTKQNENLFPMTGTELSERASQLAKLIGRRDARAEAHREYLKEYKEEIDGMNESISALAADIEERGPENFAKHALEAKGPLATGIEEVEG